MDNVDQDQQQGPQQQDQEAAQAPHQQVQDNPRVRRTHKDDLISSILSKLSLREKLSTNKEIEEKNKERDLQTLRHRLDPILHPDPGSETASLVTIEVADVEDLKDPSMFARFLSVLPDSLIQRITRENRREREEKEKRKRDDGPKSPTEEAREVKRRCMDGDKAAERVVGSQNPIQFSDILYVTDGHTALPLTFFLNKHLRHIIDHGATLSTVKSNPREGETKGSFILDVPKLTVIFGAELTMDFGQWHEAAANCYRFHMSRDKNGDSGSYSQWWSHHLGFFNMQEDKIDMYDAWKALELRLRREYRTQPTQYDPLYYAAQYELCKSEYRAEVKMREMFTQANRSANVRDDRDSPRENFTNNRTGGVKPPFSRFRQGPTGATSSNQSFQSSSRRTTLPVCCILCAERGHPVSSHYNGVITVPEKSSDGRTIWARIINSVLSTPDGRKICINFNIMGDRGLGCSHQKDHRVHVCSFCGSKNHHAFSWTCRSRPYSE